jgi:membrane protein implicated in regulation of membrane protease activity
MNFLGILLIIGFVLILRSKVLRKTFLKWFGILTVVILVFYFLIDRSQFLDFSNILGMVIMAFVIAMLVAFARKWRREGKSHIEGR